MQMGLANRMWRSQAGLGKPEHDARRQGPGRTTHGNKCLWRGAPKLGTRSKRQRGQLVLYSLSLQILIVFCIMNAGLQNNLISSAIIVMHPAERPVMPGG